MLPHPMRLSHACLLPLVLVACASDAPPPAAAAPAPSPPPAPVATATPAPAPVTVKRPIFEEGRASGTDVVTIAADGTVTETFDIVENGRGPHTDVTMHLAPDGTLTSFDAHGHYTFGAPVEESFAIDGGHAHWKSRSETGDVSAAGPAFYVPTAPCAMSQPLLVQAALKAGGKMALYPAGEARVEKLGSLEVHAGGQTKQIVLYDMTGLDLTPDHVWMQDDGSFFGFAYPGYSMLPEGWDGVAKQLVDEQLKLDRARDAAVAKRYAHAAPPAGLAFTHARVLDVEKGAWIKDATVLVVGDTIAKVGPSKSVKVPAGAEVVDLTGKALAPGLWDMHAHLGDADGVLDIASGVTTTRDCGNDPDQLDDYKARFDAGTAVGPHVLRAGLVEGRGEKAAASKITAETPDEATAAVEFYAKRGDEMMKIYNSMKPELVPVITKAAHAHGMTVTGHVPVHMLASEAVKAGYDGIEHINMLFLNFLADHDTDTRTTARFTLVGDKGGGLDLSSKPVKDFVALLHDHHTVIDPTFVTFETTFTAQQGRVVPGQQWVADRLPVQVRRAMLTGELPLEGKEDTYAKSWQNLLRMAKVLTDAKVPVVAGTDALAGLSLDRELQLFVSAGLTPAEALRDATIVPARAMRLEKKTGSIAAGKTADLAIIDGDPLANIDDVRKVVSTVRAGVVYPSKELFETVGVKDWQ
jgi:imidazolonepropionase-like amidohydrolase